MRKIITTPTTTTTPTTATLLLVAVVLPVFQLLLLSFKKLKVSETKILRSIYGPVQDTNNEWRVKTIQEIEALMKEENIVRFIKSQRSAGYGHVNRMEDNKNVKRYN
jgi:hypothetical protein